MYDLIHGNCIDALRAMPDKSIDCVITDMPYGVGIDFGDYEDSSDNLKRLIAEALPEMRRVGRRVLVMTGIKNMHLYPQPTWTLCWYFGGGGRGRWGFSHWQPILAYGPDPLPRLKMTHTDVINSSSSALADKSEHPSPKPLRFMRKLINRVAPSPADIILDPFMGSGTTGVAAIQLGHKFIGVDINADYVRLAERRIAQASPDFQLTLNLNATEVDHERA